MIPTRSAPPPGLNPRSGLPSSSPISERKTYDAVAGALPSGWHAWHSLKLRILRGEYSEGDFIIADPGRGMLVLEVKGGQVVKREGQWYQSGHPINSPLQQPLFFVKCLLSVFEEKKLTAPPIGVAVAFPDMYTDEPPTQGDLGGIVVTARELQYFEEILPQLFEKAMPANIRREPSAGWVDFVHDLWCECWPIRMNLSMRAREDMKARLGLDPTQFTVLRSLMENPRALIKGGAGTGKTLLALKLALSEAEAGKSVLLLTFTDALGDELAKQTEGADITVSPIGRLALGMLRRTGFKEPEVYAPEFWERVMRKAAAFRLTGARPGKWDSVIVDEGQDMGRDEWRFIRKCMTKSSSLRIFVDPGQAFWEHKAIPESVRERCAVFNLVEPYRCPSAIQALADAYLGKPLDEEAVGKAVEEGVIRIEAVGEGGDVREAVGAEIGRLLREGFQPYEIAVISLRGLQFEGNIAHCGKLGDHAFVKATDKDMADRIVCDSFLRFKGLERPAVVVTDLRHVSDKYETRMNIAITRAMGVLRIVAEEEQIGKDGILGRLRKKDTVAGAGGT